jgi:hypothetical protein
MKYDPLTKKLYTDRYNIIKKLNCPYKMQWNNLLGHKSPNKQCSICDSLIINTDKIEDEKLLNMVREKPESCLKINLNQDNIRIISKGLIQEK